MRVEIAVLMLLVLTGVLMWSHRRTRHRTLRKVRRVRRHLPRRAPSR
jgi:hypothetical protein